MVATWYSWAIFLMRWPISHQTSSTPSSELPKAIHSPE